MRKPCFHPSRPAGRLFYCLISVLLAVGVSRGTPPPPPPATTTISDVIYRADGSTAAGTLLITWPAFTTADNRAVPAGSMSLAIGPFGAINLALAPNQGATPAGTYYKVVMKLNDGTTSEEFWVVPTLSPTTISAIRSQVVPAGVALQVVSRQYVDGQLATVVHRTGDESVAGVKQFSSSPTVPTPTTDTAAANKAYVDAASPSPNNYVLKSGDTMSGTLTTPGMVSAKINNIRFADQFANIQAGITDAGTTGAVLIPSSYSGTDTYTNTNNTSVIDLRGGPFKRQLIQRVSGLGLASGGGSLAAGTYTVFVTAVDAAGGEGLGPITISQDTITVGASSSITASWTATPGAAKYNVYISQPNGGFVAQRFQVAASPLTITSILPNNPAAPTVTLVSQASTLPLDNYTVLVTAIDAAGGETDAFQTPGLSSTWFQLDANAWALNRALKIDWSAVTGAVGYRVYISSDLMGGGRGFYHYISVGNVTTYTWSGQALTFQPAWGNSDEISAGVLYVPSIHTTGGGRVHFADQLIIAPGVAGDAAVILDRKYVSSGISGIYLRQNTANYWTIGMIAADLDPTLLRFNGNTNGNLFTLQDKSTTVPAGLFYHPGADATPLGVNTDAGGIARFRSQNNGVNFWEFVFDHGATKQFLIQAPTAQWLKFNDTANTATFGNNSSTVTTMNGSVSMGALTGTSGTFTSTIKSTAGDVRSTLDGSDAVAAGAFYALQNTAVTRQWLTQLSASNNYDWWHFNGASWAKQATLSNGGVLNALTGFQVNGAAASGRCLRGDGTNFIPSASNCALASDNLSLFAATTSAQLAGVLSDETGSGKAMFNDVPVLKSYTVSALPAAGTADRIAIVTDAATTGSCTSGGGTNRSFCRDTGSAWEPLGDGGSGGGGGANTALSNLASVAVNAALIPGADGTLDLGSSALGWKDLYAKGAAAVGPAAAGFDSGIQNYLSQSLNSFRTLNTANGTLKISLLGLFQDNTANDTYGVFGVALDTHTSGTKSNVFAVEGDAYALGTTTVTNLGGLKSYLQQNSGATVTTMAGVTAYNQVNSGATAVTSVYGVWAQGNNLDAAITVPTIAGVRIAATTKSAGTITNNIGLDIASQTVGAANYAIRTGTGLVSFGDATSATIFDASTGYRVGGAAASGNVLRGNGTNFVSSALACADVTNCAPLVASGTAGVGPSKVGTASTAARSDHDHRSFATLTWYFPGTPSTGVSPMILAVPQGIVNGTIAGMQVTVATTSASSSTFNLQRCTASCTGTGPTFANIYSSDNTLSANTSEADFGTTNLTTTLNAKDQFKANLVTIGSGLANVTITLTYKYDTTN